jgi:hypothetical protein
MTEKGFLHKAKANISASAFLAQHKAWLLTGDLAIETAPILRALDESKVTLLQAGKDTEVAAKATMEKIEVIVLAHMLAKSNAKAEDTILNPKASAKPKPWMATVYNAKGEIQSRTKEDGSEEDLQKGFDISSDADRWTDRRLFDGASDWYGVVSHTTIINKHGDPLSTIIMRDDSIARILKQPKGAVCKPKPTGGGRLSFGVKVTNDRAVFSKG